MKDYVLGKDVFLKLHDNRAVEEGTVLAYVYLKNRIFVNAYLIKSGLASPDFSANHKYRERFAEIWRERNDEAISYHSL